MKLIFEKSVPGRRTHLVSGSDSDLKSGIDRDLLREKPAELPELSELDVVRHFTELSKKNYGVDDGFYPLGSCTMKYNPKMAEAVAGDTGFTALHPCLPQLPGGAGLVQGALEVLHQTDHLLREICGMAAFSLQPMAGAHGELTGVLMMAAYHKHRGNAKDTILIPDTAHGTNPATAAIAGYSVETIPSDADGRMDLKALKQSLGDHVAGLMLTCPNTLGLYNPHVKEICRMVSEVDGLTYCDGANLNALLGRCRPGDLGFDIVHVNLHKTFATPHGGGGPGAGPVGVSGKLVPFLPVSIVNRRPNGHYYLEYNRPQSIGYVAPFYGSFAVILKAYAYLLMLGGDGLLRASENAVLNANYIRHKLKPYYEQAVDQLCKHECVLSAVRQAKHGVRALDLAKALIDHGFHPPTVYFPLTVPEALMIEPTETESKETLDRFIEVMIELAKLAEREPERFKACPVSTPVGRLDEARAARKPDLAML